MTQQEAQQLINRLTDNEDYRQDLWIEFLSGHYDLSTRLERIHLRNEEIEKFQDSLHQLITHPCSSSINKILESFPLPEKSIIYWLMLGYNIDDISRYKGISQVRLHQMITVIRRNSGWNTWLLKDTSTTTKKLD